MVQVSGCVLPVSLSSLRAHCGLIGGGGTPIEEKAKWLGASTSIQEPSNKRAGVGLPSVAAGHPADSSQNSAYGVNMSLSVLPQQYSLYAAAKPFS